MKTSIYNPEHFEDRITGGVVRRHLVTYTALGVLLIVLGIAAIVFPVVATVAVTLVLGWVLLMSGIARIVHAWHWRHYHTFPWSLAGAVLVAVIGGLILFYPLPGVLTLTTLVAVLFVVSGVFRILQALQWRPRSGWLLLMSGGLVSLVLGVLLISQGLAMGVLLIGVVVGIDLIFSGGYTLSLAVIDSESP